jgi:hypothetical protein
MGLIPQAVGIVDRPHVPMPGDPGLGRYKEWWHFNLLDDASGLDLIVNLSLSGNIREADQGQANLILLSHEPSIGWTGGVAQYDGLAAILSEDTVDLRLGGSNIGFDGEAYRLKMRDLEHGPIELDLRLRPATEPMLVWKNTPIGEGHINWLILADLTVEGEIQIADRRYLMHKARCYHDHNWGFWRWGENFGWDWGFCAAATEVEGRPLSFVYDRTVDRAGNRVVEHSLVLWHGEKLLKFFARHMIQMRRAGHYRGRVRRIPGVANLINPAQVGTIPGRVDIIACDEEDRLEASYIPDTALQIGIPRETGFGLVELNETLGWLTLSGSVGGMSFMTTRRACFEFVG